MSLSKTKQTLKEKLYATWDDRDFVMGIGSMLVDDNDAQEMMDYLDSNEWNTFSDLILKALTIYKRHNIPM
jgi:hypothetical protein